MDTSPPRSSPVTAILPLPLDGIATQAAWSFEPGAREVEAGYQRARGAFDAEDERDTLAPCVEVSAQLTFAERLDRPKGERGPKRRKLPGT